MSEQVKWTEFTEDRTSGWRADNAAGVEMEVWTSYDEPTQFRVVVDKALEPDFYPDRATAMAAAERLAAGLKAGP